MMDWDDWALFGLGVGIAHPSTRSYTAHVAYDSAIASARFGWSIGKSFLRHLPKLGPVTRNLPWIAVAAEVTNFGRHLLMGGSLSDYDPVVAGRQGDFVARAGGYSSSQDMIDESTRDVHRGSRRLTTWGHHLIGRVFD